MMTASHPRRTAIVTGGSIGIGHETARQLLENGVDVMIVGRRKEVLDSALASLVTFTGVDGASLIAVPADVAVDEDLNRVIETAIATWGRIDILVNNAGIFDDATMLTLTRRSWEDVLAVNLTAPFLLSQKVGAIMVKQGTGSIVNMASVDGHGVDGTYVAYNVSKAALLQLSRQTAVELGPFGVRCNSVSPGWARTPMVEAALSESQLVTMNNDWARAPIRRMVTPAEVASTVVFLSSPAASGITGTDVVVDGGVISNLWILETLPADTQA